MLRLSPEELLLRWVNLHLRNAGSTRTPVNSFGEAFKDGVVFSTLCRQIAPDASADLPEEAVSPVLAPGNALCDLHNDANPRPVSFFCVLVFGVSGCGPNAAI